MLGHKAYQVLGSSFEVFATTRTTSLPNEVFGSAPNVERADAFEISSIAKAVVAAKPHCVINCIGLVKQRPDANDAEQAIYLNALFPHLVADICSQHGARLVHLSTDCVFSGARGNYRETDAPDPVDMYGRSKLLGEVDRPGVLTLRTSMIGRELSGSLSLTEWFLSQTAAPVKGFTNARFSGLTTRVAAREIASLIERSPNLSGIFHLAGEPISKYDLLLLLKEAFHTRGEIGRFDDFHCDRTLSPEKLERATGFTRPRWKDMIADMVADPTPYAAIRAIR